MFANDGPVIGETKLTLRALKIIGALLLAFCLFHVVRLWSGSVSWLGMEERHVRIAPQWMHTPISTNVASDGFGLSLPVVALKGQEIVIRYELSSEQQDTAAPYADLLVSCLCPMENFGHFKVETPGRGEIVMPVHQTAIYTLSLSQSVGPMREPSDGSYYWGVKSGGQ